MSSSISSSPCDSCCKKSSTIDIRSKITIDQLAKSIGIQTDAADASRSNVLNRKCERPGNEDISDTFYQRELPQNLIRLSSPEGKQLFRESLDEGHAEGFFPLTGNFTTQSEPAYCGPGSLAMVLNALEVDPQRRWKGVWRWYSDELLHCCSSAEDVKENGITFDTFACLARCHASVKVKRANTFTLEEFEKDVEYITSRADHFMVLSFSRNTLGQTGDGHFSPIGAYNAANKLVLIMDTARYKYPIYWCPLSVVFESMKPVDEVTGRPRGYFLLSYDQDHPPLSVCLTKTDSNFNDIKPCSKTCLLDPQESGLNWTGLANSFCKGISEDLYKNKPATLDQIVSIVIKHIPRELTTVLARQSVISLGGSSSFTKTEKHINVLLEDTRKTPLYLIVLNAIYPDRKNKSYTPIDLNASYTTLILLGCSSLLHSGLPKEVQELLDKFMKNEDVTPFIMEEVERISEEIINLIGAFCECKTSCNKLDCCSKTGCCKT